MIQGTSGVKVGEQIVTIATNAEKNAKKLATTLNMAALRDGHANCDAVAEGTNVVFKTTDSKLAEGIKNSAEELGNFFDKVV